jgi:hypothetical protein
MQQPSSPRRRTASIVGAAAIGALAATGVGIAFADDEVPTEDTAAAEVADARYDLAPRAHRVAWTEEVGEYVEADMVRRYAIGVYARLADWQAAAEYAEAAAAQPSYPSGTNAHLQAIKACESGGDYTAVSPSGTYRGAYQFDHATWQGVGGTGDPAAASPAEQDMRAQMLYDQSGPSPWPVCGS